ncbi:MAG: GIY-YIG nuclease family protein [Candidatus Dojkabacteria bacterium]|nr:GIY-YIG nuclease family protein [Candidatus Dojkabacteria bacterium]
MNKPKTIKIFLSDGEPTGTKIVELSNWSGVSYLIPRNRLKETLQNEANKSDLNSQCIYFLIGSNEENEKSVYIGEAEEFSKRITQHNKNKDFWNLVMVFTSKEATT